MPDDLALHHDLATLPAPGRIATIEDLREHLQWAIELEHTTIPPYLCALYSLDADRNPEAVEVLTSVLVEEMLHLALAANLLNAVGGRPVIDHPRLLAPYPRCVPHGDRRFEVSLLPFGERALEQFMRIEQPAPADAPEADEGYETIGQFYAAVEHGLARLCAEHGEAAVFTGDPARQIADAHLREGHGAIVTVTDLASAQAAVAEIVEQGEGADHSQVWDGTTDMFHPERHQVAHYYRFQALQLGRRYAPGDVPATGPTGEPIAVDWDGIRPMEADPRPAPDDTVVGFGQALVDATYGRLLGALDEAFDGRPERLERAIREMFTLKAQATELIGLPLDDGTGRTAGPTFRYVDPAARD